MLRDLMVRLQKQAALRVTPEEILENIVQLSELLDDEALKEITDLPFIELAKAISINRPKAELLQGVANETKEKRRRMLPHRYSSRIRKRAAKSHLG